jgi:hypothetical protein
MMRLTERSCEAMRCPWLRYLLAWQVLYKVDAAMQSLAVLATGSDGADSVA